MPMVLDETGLRKMFPEVAEIQDAKLRQGVVDIWCEIAAEMAWNSFEDIPKNIKSERYRCLVPHVQAVTRMALSLAEIAKEVQGRTYDRDLLIAICLLHDASKPVETEPDPDGTAIPGSTVLPPRVSDLGSNLPHATYITHKVLEKGLGNRLAHLLITHTHACNVRGKGWEAAVLFYADFADTDAGIAPTGEQMYSQRWKLH